MVGKNLKVFPLSSYSGGVVILLGTLGPDRVRKKNTSLAGTVEVTRYTWNPLSRYICILTYIATTRIDYPVRYEFKP